ncbi:class I SAM-dependent methyltransferase [Candidatus Omnitrophota bacterium]
MSKGQIRHTSFGQKQRLSFLDIFGRYLSERMVSKILKRLKKPDIVMMDIGCGYDGSMMRKFSPLISKGVAIDVAVSQDLKSVPNLKVYEQPIENVLPNLDENYFDVILMNSVLEHLEDPLFVLKECRRALKESGILICNVPTWLGKYFLEKAAYVFKLSPIPEVDDHKMYYDKRDLWPVLVKSGFKSSSIKLTYHKFGLDLYSVCGKKPMESYSIYVDREKG